MVDFKNTVIIMTSNLGSSAIVGPNIHDKDAMKQPGDGRLREHFRPEFLNRIDETVIFEPLTRDQIGDIVQIQLQRVSDRLADRSITLLTTEGAREWIANRGYDPVYGARPLKRVIQREVLDSLALKLLNGELHDGEAITVDVGEGGLNFQAELTEAPMVA